MEDLCQFCLEQAIWGPTSATETRCFCASLQPCYIPPCLQEASVYLIMLLHRCGRLPCYEVSTQLVKHILKLFSWILTISQDELEISHPNISNSVYIPARFIAKFANRAADLLQWTGISHWFIVLPFSTDEQARISWLTFVIVQCLL